MKLTRKDIEIIKAFDAKARKEWCSSYAYDTGACARWQCNRCMRHNYIKPLKNGELAIITVACRIHKGKFESKTIAAMRTDSDRFYWRDVDFHGIAGWIVIWSNSKPTPSGYYPNPRDVIAMGWQPGTYKYREALCFPWANTVNPEALNGTKYAHCGYDGGPLLDWLKLYRQNRGVEFLAKSGLECLVTPGGIKRLTKNREFFAWVRNHAREIAKEGCYSFSVLQYAQVHGLTIKAALEHFKNVNTWRVWKLPNAAKKHVDEITAHMLKKKIEIAEYSRYLEYAEKAGWDLNDRHIYLPPVKNWASFLEYAEQEAEKAERIRQAKADRAMDKKIAATVRKFMKLAEIKDTEYEIVLPESRANLREEGKSMNNCIGIMGYDRKIVNGESLIVFVRLRGKVHSDIEIDRMRGVIRQHYTRGNHKPDEKTLKFGQAILKAYRRIERKLKKAA